MIYLAPNVYVLEYLMNTKQLSGANEENAYRFIQSGELYKGNVHVSGSLIITYSLQLCTLRALGEGP